MPTYPMTPTTAYRVEETTFLLSCGRSFCEIAAQLGTTPLALVRCLYRAGRADLAAHCQIQEWGLR